VQPAGWHILATGCGPESLLAIDFDVTQSRGTAGFGDLASRLPDRYTVLGVDPLAWPPAGPRADRVAAWLERVERLGAGTVGILAYCAGGSLACAAARHLAERGRSRPTVVLFDPTRVGADTLTYQFGLAVDNLAANLTKDERKGATAGATADADAATALDDLARLLSQRYGDLVTRACNRMGINRTFAQELSGRIRRYLQYLTLAGAVELDITALHAHVIRSSGDPGELAAAGTEARFPVAQEKLLMQQGVADTITRLLTVESPA
jgi:thioesterase domain-containing protein